MSKTPAKQEKNLRKRVLRWWRTTIARAVQQNDDRLPEFGPGESAPLLPKKSDCKVNK